MPFCLGLLFKKSIWYIINSLNNMLLDHSWIFWKLSNDLEQELNFSVSLHMMTSDIECTCYQLCCCLLSNFETEALPHQCKSSPNHFTSHSSISRLFSEWFSLSIFMKSCFCEMFLFFSGK